MEGLKPNTEYSFSLAAISNKGIGAFTNELVQRTSQASMSEPAANGLYFVKPFFPTQTPPAARSALSQPPERLQPSLHRSICLLYQPSPLSSILTVPFLLPSASGSLTQPQQTCRMESALRLTLSLFLFSTIPPVSLLNECLISLRGHLCYLSVNSQ